jgi:hypothetical protein
MFEKHPSGSFDGNRRGEAKINIDISGKKKKKKIVLLVRVNNSGPFV